MKKVFLLLIIIMLSGCATQEAPIGIKPMTENLIPTHPDWKDAYGDTLETQMVFNLAVIRSDQQGIFNLITATHPSLLDPNVPSLESRVEELEDSEIDPNIVTPIELQVTYPKPISHCNEQRGNGCGWNYYKCSLHSQSPD